MWVHFMKQFKEIPKSYFILWYENVTKTEEIRILENIYKMTVIRN